MIYHPLIRLRRAGIEEVVVVTSPEHMGDVVNLLGSGKRLGLDLTYRVQDEPGGIAQALALTETFVGDSPFVVVLGDNILGEDIGEEVEAFKNQLSNGPGARVLLKEVPDPERYGVPEFDGDQILRVIEKPEAPPSSYSVVGIYFYDTSVFAHVSTLSPSQRGELEISDVSNIYAAAGSLTHGFLNEWWGDAGTFDGLEEANSLARDLIYEELSTEVPR